MKDRKLQVFVSSTYIDLKEEREAAVEAILSSGHIPAGMELFSAGDESQMTVIKRWIDESDVYLLILGGRYGSIDTDTGKSYTQLEYEYAVETGKPLFAVVISETAIDSRIKQLGAAAIEKNINALDSFRASVLTKLVKIWDDKKDIKLAIHETLSDFSYRKDLIGWVRGDKAINSPLLAEEIARLTKENAELRDRVSKETNSVLYAGLTFNQLEELLKRDTFNYRGKPITPFDYLLITGSLFVLEYKYVKEEVDLQRALILYKLVTSYYKNGFLNCRFTEDGHNFYLKTLYKYSLS